MAYSYNPDIDYAKIQSRAKETAEGVLELNWDEDKFPVDPFEIAASFDVGVFTSDLPDDVSGMTAKADNQVFVNGSHHERRQRFTTAHELGHYFDVEDNREISVDRRRDALAERGTDPFEIFANAFAANLLMPEMAVKSLRRRGMGTQDLAAFFDVSNIAMSNRLKNLGLS